MQNVMQKNRCTNFANAHIQNANMSFWQMTSSKISIFLQYSELYRKILNSRLIVSRFARMLVCKQLIFIKKFFAHSQRENLQNYESTKRQYSASLLSIDLEKYVLHSTMPNCLISQHIFQRLSALSPAKPRLEMFGCLARLCAPITPTKLIIYHFFGHVGGLAGIMPCLNVNINHLVFAYNIDYIKIGFGAQMYGKY